MSFDRPLYPVLTIQNDQDILEFYHATNGLLMPGLWQALKVDPRFRTQEQAQLVYAWLMQIRTESLLQRLHSTTLHALPTISLQFEYYPHFDIVTWQGSPSDCAYLLIAGSISVWLNRDQPKPQPAPTPVGLPTPSAANSNHALSSIKTPASQRLPGNGDNSVPVSDGYVFADGGNSATGNNGNAAAAKRAAGQGNNGRPDSGGLLSPIDEASSAMEHDSDLSKRSGLNDAQRSQSPEASWRAHPATRRLMGQRLGSTRSASSLGSGNGSGAAGSDNLMADQMLSSLRSPNGNTMSPARHRLVGGGGLVSTTHNLSQTNLLTMTDKRADGSAITAGGGAGGGSEKVAKYFTFGADASASSSSSSSSSDAAVKVPPAIDPNAPPLTSSPSLQGSVAASPCSSPTRAGPRLAKMGDHVPGLGDCVGFIKAGSERFSLGELGLLEKIPRTATLRAEEPVVLLRIDQDVFDKYIKCDILADLNIKLTALRNCPLLKGLDDLTLKRLSVHFRLHKFRARQTIYNEGDLIRNVFLIVDGRCEISRKVTMNDSSSASSSQQAANSASGDPAFSSTAGSPRTHSFDSSSSPGSSNSSSSSSSFSSSSSSTPVLLTVASEGQFFGCEAAMFESTEIESGLRVKAESLAALKQQQKMAQNASGWVKLPDSDNEKDKKRRKRASIVGNAGTLVKSANGAGAGAGAGGAPGGRGARGPNGGGPSGQQPGNGGPSAVAGEPAENKKIGFGIHELSAVSDIGVRHRETAVAASYLVTLCISARELSKNLPVHEFDALKEEASDFEQQHLARVEEFKQNAELLSILTGASSAQPSSKTENKLLKLRSSIAALTGASAQPVVQPPSASSSTSSSSSSSFSTAIMAAGAVSVASSASSSSPLLTSPSSSLTLPRLRSGSLSNASPSKFALPVQQSQSTLPRRSSTSLDFHGAMSALSMSHSSSSPALPRVGSAVGFDADDMMPTAAAANLPMMSPHRPVTSMVVASRLHGSAPIHSSSSPRAESSIGFSSSCSFSSSSGPSSTFLTSNGVDSPISSSSPTPAPGLFSSASSSSLNHASQTYPSQPPPSLPSLRLPAVSLSFSSQRSSSSMASPAIQALEKAMPPAPPLSFPVDELTLQLLHHNQSLGLGLNINLGPGQPSSQSQQQQQQQQQQSHQQSHQSQQQQQQQQQQTPQNASRHYQMSPLKSSYQHLLSLQQKQRGLASRGDF